MVLQPPAHCTETAKSCYLIAAILALFVCSQANIAHMFAIGGDEELVALASDVQFSASGETRTAAAETSAAESPLRAEVRQLIRLEQPQKSLPRKEVVDRDRIILDA